MVRDGLRLAEIREVLTKAREEQTDAVFPEGLSRSQRLLGGFTGHEAADRAAGEWQPRKVFLEPCVAGHPEQDVAHASPSNLFVVGWRIYHASPAWKRSQPPRKGLWWSLQCDPEHLQRADLRQPAKGGDPWVPTLYRAGSACC